LPLRDTDRRLAQHLARSKHDPHYFNDVVLQRPAYWGSADSPLPEYPGQVEWCTALVRHHTLAIETGNMLGKDYWIAGIILWWLWTRRDALVIVTGPGQTTIGTVTWKELRAAVRACPFANRGLPLTVSDGAKTSPAVAQVRPGWTALGYSTTSVERASGHHAADLLVIVEEASGVEDEAWEAIDSLGASRVVAIGNPLRPDGGFAELCDQGDADARDDIPALEAVCHFNVPSTASPDAPSAEKRRGLAWGGWISQQLRHWGEKSLWSLAHIYAIRPKVSSQVLLPEAWLDWAASQARESVPFNHPIHATRRIACDLGEGEGADDSCVLVRDDWGILDVVLGKTMGLDEAAEAMWRLGLKYDVPASRMSYDRMGIGRKMPNYLARHGLKDAIGYAGAGRPASGDFVNLRTEAAWKLHQRLDPEFAPDPRRPHLMQRPFCIPCADYWPRLRSELKALTYSMVNRKTRLLPKKDWCDILGHSPDIADALIQSFAF
jgi:hypothetical protein